MPPLWAPFAIVRRLPMANVLQGKCSWRAPSNDEKYLQGLFRPEARSNDEKFLRKGPPMTTVGRPPSPCPPRDFPNTLLSSEASCHELLFATSPIGSRVIDWGRLMPPPASGGWRNTPATAELRAVAALANRFRFLCDHTSIHDIVPLIVIGVPGHVVSSVSGCGIHSDHRSLVYFLGPLDLDLLQIQ